MVEHCANRNCPRRDNLADYLGPRNAIMVDAPELPSFSCCSWHCLVAVAQSYFALDAVMPYQYGTVINECESFESINK